MHDCGALQCTGLRQRAARTIRTSTARMPSGQHRASLSRIAQTVSPILNLDAGANGVVWFAMVKLLEQAIAEVASLPAADQEQIGRSLLSHVEKLRKLRAEIDKGLRSLDAGGGRPLDIEEFIRESIQKHGRS